MSNATFGQYLRLGAMIKDGSIDRKTLQAIIEGRVEILDRPREQTYRLHVSYAPLPGVAALEPKFSGKGSVSCLFDGREWERHSSCAKIDETPGERDFRVAEIPAEFLGKRIEDIWKELAAHFDREGYRFAIETEAVEFADEDPEAQRKNYILALGSSTLRVGGNRYVSMLGVDGRVRILYGSWIGYGLNDRGRLLLVRK